MCVVYICVFQWNFQEWLFEQNIINDEKLSGIVQKEKSTLYLRPCTVCVMFVYENFQKLLFVCIINLGGFGGSAPYPREFSLKPPRETLNLSAIQLSRDEYFNGGRCFFFSNACLLPTAFESGHNGLCKFETTTLFRTPEFSLLLLLHNSALQSV